MSKHYYHSTKIENDIRQATGYLTSATIAFKRFHQEVQPDNHMLLTTGNLYDLVPAGVLLDIVLQTRGTFWS